MGLVVRVGGVGDDGGGVADTFGAVGPMGGALSSVVIASIMACSNMGAG